MSLRKYPIILPVALGMISPLHALTYGLAGGSESWPADKRNAIISAMDVAVATYNAYGYFDKHVTATYNPGVPTAQANYEGWMEFGGSISSRVAMHELGHTLGGGTYWAWNNNRANGLWTGVRANARIQLYDGAGAVLNCDGLHSWPYGLNQDNEDSTTNRMRHVKMMAAMRWDMGLVGDSDGDGMPDDWEIHYFGNLDQPAAADTDGDGANTLAEYAADTHPKTWIPRTWKGGAGAWDTAGANWNGGSSVWPVNPTPGAGFDNDAIFSGSAGVVSISGGVVVADIDFNITGYQLGGAALTLGASYPDTTSGYVPLVPRIGVVAGATATINAPLAGNSGLSKTGAGTLRLNGANTLTGKIDVREGVVALSSANLPAGVTLRIGSGAKAALDFSGVQFVSSLELGSLTIPPGTYDAVSHPASFSGTGKITVGSPMQWTGTVSGVWNLAVQNWSNGTPSAWAANQDAIFGASGRTAIDLAVNIPARRLVFQQSGYRLSSGSGRSLSLGADSPNIFIGGDATIQVPVTGPSGLGMLGGSRLRLDSKNTFTGHTVIDGGTLALLDGGAIYTAGYAGSATLSIRNGGTLELDRWGYGPSGTGYRVQSLGGLDYQPGRFVIDGGTVKYTGGTAGAPQNPAEAAYGPGFTIGAAGATLDAAKSGDLWTVKNDSRGFGVVASPVGGTLTLTGIGNGAFDKVLPGGGALVKTGAGNWSVTQACTATGNVTVRSGKLSILNGGALFSGGFTASPVVRIETGGTLELDRWGYGPAGSGYRVQSLGGLDSHPEHLVLDGGTVKFTGGAAGAPQDPSELPYGPGFTVGPAGATFDASKAGDVWTVKGDTRGFGTVVSTAAGTVTLTGIGDGVFDKLLPGNGALVKSGAAKWTLTQANTYTGETRVLQGTLATSQACLSNSAALRIAAGAKLHLNFTGSDAVAALELGGLTVGPGTYGAAHPRFGSYFAGTGSVVVPGTPRPYDVWADGFTGFTDFGFERDQDNDGLANGLEWLLGGNPTVQDLPSIQPRFLPGTAENMKFVFGFTPAALGGMDLFVEWGTELDGGFENVKAIGNADAPADANGVTVDVGAPSAGQCTVVIPNSNAPAGKLFARLRVTSKP